jgi:hypothetical protein
VCTALPVPLAGHRLHGASRSPARAAPFWLLAPPATAARPLPSPAPLKGLRPRRIPLPHARAHRLRAAGRVRLACAAHGQRHHAAARLPLRKRHVSRCRHVGQPLHLIIRGCFGHQCVAARTTGLTAVGAAGDAAWASSLSTIGLLGCSCQPFLCPLVHHPPPQPRALIRLQHDRPRRVQGSLCARQSAAWGRWAGRGCQPLLKHARARLPQRHSPHTPLASLWRPLAKGREARHACTPPCCPAPPEPHPPDPALPRPTPPCRSRTRRCAWSTPSGTFSQRRPATRPFSQRRSRGWTRASLGSTSA